ncbi:hypothetical protein BB559_001695 [Furculomyces boomerangus]|uniref:Exonuclease domain-containing protein n=1 Tax=Furculomyces boomerangus TaxID=61424 RepID=A0A2T9Z124_9FUNG|nr:hypothetical protein BB559_001695 [Furculomyces boomerangus]
MFPVSENFNRIPCPYSQLNIKCPGNHICPLNHYSNQRIIIEMGKQNLDPTLIKKPNEISKLKFSQISLKEDQNGHVGNLYSVLSNDISSNENLNSKSVPNNENDSSMISVKCPQIKPKPNQKVPWTMRQKVLELVYRKLLDAQTNIHNNSASPDIDIGSEALKIEDKIYRNSTSMTYRNNAANETRKLTKQLGNGENIYANISKETDSATNSINNGDSKILDLEDSNEARIFYSFLASVDDMEKLGYPLVSVIENGLSEENAKTCDDAFEWIKNYMSFRAKGVRTIPNSDNSNYGKIDFSELVGKKANCERCGLQYEINLPSKDPQIKKQCKYHHGRIRMQFNDSPLFFAAKRKNDKTKPRKYYTCCNNDPLSPPCEIGPHTLKIENDGILHALTPYKKTILNKSKYKVLAIDCEMASTTIGSELARVTVVDHFENTVLDELVKIKGEVLDLNTRYSGLSSLDDAKYSFEEIQEKCLDLISSETVLVGHGLENDLRAMRLIHEKVIDTVTVFPHSKGLPFRKSLKDISMMVLGNIIQEAKSGHDSREDALTSMKSVVAKTKLLKRTKGKTEPKAN